MIDNTVYVAKLIQGSLRGEFEWSSFIFKLFCLFWVRATVNVAYCNAIQLGC